MTDRIKADNLKVILETETCTCKKIMPKFYIL